MTSNETILVGTDGSDASYAAIRFAAHEAIRMGIDLHLLYAAPDYAPLASMLPVPPVDLEETGRAILDRAAAFATELLPSTRVSTSLVVGPRVPELVREADQARMVALGGERTPRLERILTGSTVTGVAAARLGCPVVAVPVDWSPSPVHGRVAVGIKSTEHCHGLLDRAFDLAAERGAGVIVVHAWELAPGYDDLVSVGGLGAQWEEQARLTMASTLSEIHYAHPEVDMEIRVQHGQPARLLRSVSKEADLLVLARRDHPFPRGHLGGTARALLRESFCPVVVVDPNRKAHT